ncbi:uncharacterized protein LOC105428535 isoform X2 [Pogonomyrmex barbatus]|uniref:Uncharacterized protein LOC105428535 isoform X2 n=1 Tax=Pogonomyrmex barbatus TaxID=144034 RepID=A0A6I9WE38_9HYME|nr:uncharacterized protein LOC105428535 isoform X2 [Pogonomyrmex barbatus]
MIMAKLSTGDVPRTTKLFTYTLVQLQRVFAKVFALDELNLPVVGTSTPSQIHFCSATSNPAIQQ